MVKFSDIEDAFLFASSSFGESSAVLQRSTGRIFYRSDSSGVDDLADAGLEDAWENDDLIDIPDQRELDLGRRLVFRFVRKELPDKTDAVEAIFSRRGAYGRFKDFLDERGLLQAWQDFENEASRQALREWCQDNGIEVSD